MQQQLNINNSTNRALDDIRAQVSDTRTQISKLTQAMSTTPSGKLPSQPFPNPKGQANMTEASASGSTSHEQVQAVTTLRSGKVIQKPVDPRVENLGGELSSKNGEETEKLRKDKGKEIEDVEKSHEQDKKEGEKENEEEPSEGPVVRPIDHPIEYMPRPPFP